MAHTSCCVWGSFRPYYNTTWAARQGLKGPIRRVLTVIAAAGVVPALFPSVIGDAFARIDSLAAVCVGVQQHLAVDAVRVQLYLLGAEPGGDGDGGAVDVDFLLPLLRACLKSFDKREGKADNKGKQAGDEGECVNIQAISAGKSMRRYERI